MVCPAHPASARQPAARQALLFRNEEAKDLFGKRLHGEGKSFLVLFFKKGLLAFTGPG
jgi:hypothetical protein